MNGQSSLILSVEGGEKKENHRKEMSKTANVANRVISHRDRLPEELRERRQICTNKLMGAAANDFPGPRNFSC